MLSHIYTHLKNVALKGFKLNIRNNSVACHIADLVPGETLMCETIISGAVIGYLSTGADLSRPANMLNSCFDIMGD